jgi:hypothetical protein
VFRSRGNSLSPEIDTMPPAVAKPGIGQNQPPQPVLVSVKSLRASHGFTEKRVYQLERDGEIKFARIGGRTFVVRASVDALVARSSAQSAPRPMPPSPRRRRPSEGAAAALPAPKARAGRRNAKAATFEHPKLR